MHILLTNDDGIFAPGLAAMYRALTALGDVMVVAPLESRSGASHSVTIFEPLTCTKVDIDGLFSGFAVHGSPADCVKLAVMQLQKEPIDLVVAGVNDGANVGINVYYSGTVAAAIEAAFLRIPSVAISLARGPQMDFDQAARLGVSVLGKLMPIQQGEVVNVNVPSLSQGKPKGIRVVPQATSGFDEHYVPHSDGPGHTAYQLAGGAHREETVPADTTALVDGYITVTALLADLTDHKKTDVLAARLGDAAA
jgi:5'-nucleotidase